MNKKRCLLSVLLLPWLAGLFTLQAQEPAGTSDARNTIAGLGASPTVDRISLLLDYETGYGGAIYPVYNPYVFFTNGTVVKEPKTAVEDLDHKARSKEEGRWGKWKQAGNKVKIAWDGLNRKGKVETSEKDWPGHQAYPAGATEKLDGAWSTIGGGGNLAFGGSIGIVATKDFRFTPDGRFTTGSMAGISAPGQVGRSQKSAAGSYTLSHHTLELKFDNGQTKKLFFCYMGKEKKDVLRIGGSAYTPSKKKP
ncbi:MAG TPA: hypothetical protein PK339_09390 [Flavitalea sp.]|nr:hypothetical protein [Flavitalea sp.]